MNENTYMGYNAPIEELDAFMADRRAGLDRAIQFAEEERRDQGNG